MDNSVSRDFFTKVILFFKKSLRFLISENNLDFTSVSVINDRGTLCILFSF